MDTSIIPLKQCNRKHSCNHPKSKIGWLPATSDYFHKNSRAKDGFFNSCKVCTLLSNKAWREQNPTYFSEYDAQRAEKHAADMRQHRHANPETHRQRDKERYPHRAAQQIQYQRNRRQTEAHKKQSKSYHARPDILNRYRVHASNRRAREMALEATLTIAQWTRCLEHFESRCAVCHRPQGLWHFLAADHWIPVTKGGGTTANNIAPLCHGMDGCNNSKCNREPQEWLEWKFGKQKAEEIMSRVQGYFDAIT